MSKVTLPSGATLEIHTIPFTEAKALYQAILSEGKAIKVDSSTELSSIFKELFCIGFSSPRVEACLAKCLARCTYNDLKIDDQTFEPMYARQDYTMVCLRVAKEAVDPFVKSLYAGYADFIKEMQTTQS